MDQPAQSKFDPSNYAAHYAAVRARLTRAAIDPPKLTKPHFVILRRYVQPPMSDAEAAMYEHSYLSGLARSIARHERQMKTSTGEPTLLALLSETAEKYGLTMPELIAARRDKRSVNARHEYMWRAKKETSRSLVQIGKTCGGRDHTTVLHGIRVYQETHFG